MVANRVQMIVWTSEMPEDIKKLSTGLLTGSQMIENPTLTSISPNLQLNIIYIMRHN